MTSQTLYVLYGLLALAAAGLYLCLPGERPRTRAMAVAGTILGAAAVAGLLGYAVRWLDPTFQGRAFFALFAGIALLAAARVVTHPRPVYSAVYFILVVLAVTGLAVLAAAEFLAAALVIVYGGAILVTYVFVIMLAQQSGAAPYDASAREPLAAVVLGLLLTAGAASALGAHDPLAGRPAPQRVVFVPVALQPAAVTAKPAGVLADPTKLNTQAGNTRDVGRRLLSDHMIAVQVAGVLMLVAMVGALVIARKPFEAVAESTEHDPLSLDEAVERDKQVIPFRREDGR